MNDNQTQSFGGFIDALAVETNLDMTTAERVAQWLKAEGVLDFPVLNETYAGTR